jgi:hypothetical protein
VFFRFGLGTLQVSFGLCALQLSANIDSHINIGNID